MATVVVINGEIKTDREEATISVFDRGFLYGDSVFEALRTYAGVPFALDTHLERLEASAERIGMRLSAPLSVIEGEVRAGHHASGNQESYIRIVATRGQGTLGLDPGLAQDPVRIVIVMPLKPPSAELYDQGIRVQIVSVRRNHPKAIDPRAKTGNYLNSVLALAEARRHGAHEAIMLDGQGHVTEGASSNLFAVAGGVVLTPPLEVGILEGITRRTVLAVCQRLGRRALEVPLTPENVRTADEVFITSSIREMLPVVNINGAPVGSGVPGTIFSELRQGFAEYVQTYPAG